MPPLLQNTARGLYCPAGDFYVDPCRAVPRAVVTHAHSDHARTGSERYLCAARGAELLRHRIGKRARIEGVAFGEPTLINGVRVSLHPAGHILGSSQVRVEHRGEVWAVSGDYKLEPDITTDTFEPVRCHTFITESTFGLPIYRWRPQEDIFAEINAWWRSNQAEKRTSVLFGYSLGKAQRVLAGVDPSIGPIFVQSAVEAFLPLYRAAGVPLPKTMSGDTATIRTAGGRGLVITSQSAFDTPWMRKFGEVSCAIASGWMQVRAARKRRAFDRGFVLSDHADWPGLLEAIRLTGAERVLVTHGPSATVVRWLTEQGIEAAPLEKAFVGDRDPSRRVENGNEDRG
jgi:putative mRNA 3-end processing factor